MKKGMIVLMVAALAILTSPAAAHWQRGDPDKQINPPQLPDPNGWDVDITHNWVADDWECGGTGPVTDIHFWYSWKDDYIGEVDTVMARIWSDVPHGSGNPLPYGHPGDLLWEGTFDIDPTMVAGPLSGLQGWYDPQTELTLPDNHQQYFQINITDIQDPFYQYEGTTYWLELHMIPATPPTGETPIAGWKTSDDHWKDDAVYHQSGEVTWMHLYEPGEPISMSMAFVITPEPATITLLAAGAVAILRRRNR